MYIEVNGTKLFYRVTGKGEPLLLIHGNGENQKIFYKAAMVLKEHFTCYLVDSRGHGKSAPADALDYATMAEDLRQMLEKLDLHDVNYYGFSDGGIIGLILAQHTDRLKRLIVSGANTDPHGVKDWLYNTFAVVNKIHPDAKVAMMLEQPHISNEELQRISVPTFVLAGEKDLIKEEHTRNIAANIPNAELKIIPKEGHGSYIINSDKIAHLILGCLRPEA